jgi:hypothetical protein
MREDFTAAVEMNSKARLSASGKARLRPGISGYHVLRCGTTQGGPLRHKTVEDELAPSRGSRHGSADSQFPVRLGEKIPMPRFECPRCSTKIQALDYPTLGECPYCLARGVYPVPFLRRSSVFVGSVPSRYSQPDGATGAKAPNARLAAKRQAGGKGIGATRKASQSGQAG